MSKPIHIFDAIARDQKVIRATEDTMEVEYFDEEDMHRSSGGSNTSNREMIIHLFGTYANGDPMAIVQGSVGLVGCHLESQSHWYTKKYMQPQWHANQHHVFLAQFVADYLLQSRQIPLF